MVDEPLVRRCYDFHPGVDLTGCLPCVLLLCLSYDRHAVSNVLGLWTRLQVKLCTLTKSVPTATLDLTTTDLYADQAYSISAVLELPRSHVNGLLGKS